MNIFDNIAANLSLKYENSEFYKNKLIKRYKPLITPGVKSQDELIISLEKHFDLELTDKAVMSKTFLELCVMGNIDCDEPDMIDFEIYRVAVSYTHLYKIIVPYRINGCNKKRQRTVCVAVLCQYREVIQLLISC